MSETDTDSESHVVSLERLTMEPLELVRLTVELAALLAPGFPQHVPGELRYDATEDESVHFFRGSIAVHERGRGFELVVEIACYGPAEVLSDSTTRVTALGLPDAMTLALSTHRRDRDPGHDCVLQVRCPAALRARVVHAWNAHAPAFGPRRTPARPTT